MCCMLRDRLQKMRLRTSTGLAQTSSHQQGSSSDSGGGGGGTMWPTPGCNGCTHPYTLRNVYRSGCATSRL